MKATLIISEEYESNTPSVFIFVDSAYYGDLNYPSLRSYPDDINYWKTAVSSDSDRGFIVKSVQFSKDIFNKIESLHNEIKGLAQNLKNDNVNPWIPAPDVLKNSPEYKEYEDKIDAHAKLQREIWKQNEPIEKVIYEKASELKALLLSTSNNES